MNDERLADLTEMAEHGCANSVVIAELIREVERLRKNENVQHFLQEEAQALICDRLMDVLGKGSTIEIVDFGDAGFMAEQRRAPEFVRVVGHGPNRLDALLALAEEVTKCPG